MLFHPHPDVPVYTVRAAPPVLPLYLLLTKIYTSLQDVGGGRPCPDARCLTRLGVGVGGCSVGMVSMYIICILL
jgi:hypothetical protein